MKSEDKVILSQISDAVSAILDFTKGKETSDFHGDRMLRDACVANFLVMGEAVKRLSSDFRKNNPQIEWKKIAGMRDKMIHEYMRIDYSLLWHTIKQILPGFKEQLDDLTEI